MLECKGPMTELSLALDSPSTLLGMRNSPWNAECGMCQRGFNSMPSAIIATTPKLLLAH